eukprot:Skav227614  [mRNA]  locus=scaffold1141:630036:630718:+ [translate_table: standard]
MIDRHVQLVHQHIGSRQNQILRGGGLSQDVDVQEIRRVLTVVGQNHCWQLLTKNTSLVRSTFFKHGAIHAFR